MSRDRRRSEQPIVPDLLKPRDENDPFCSCPSCRLVGTHALIHTEYPPWPVTSDGVFIIATIGRPEPGSPAVQRRCVFCGHEWLLPRGGTASGLTT